MHVCRPSGTPVLGTAITFQRLLVVIQVHCLWPRPWPAPPAAGARPCWQPLPGDLTYPSAPAPLSAASAQAQPGCGTGPDRSCGGRCRRRWQRGSGDEPMPSPARPRGRGWSDAAPQAGPQQPARRRRPAAETPPSSGSAADWSRPLRPCWPLFTAVFKQVLQAVRCFAEPSLLWHFFSV